MCGTCFIVQDSYKEPAELYPGLREQLLERDTWAPLRYRWYALGVSSRLLTQSLRFFRGLG